MNTIKGIYNSNKKKWHLYNASNFLQQKLYNTKVKS